MTFFLSGESAMFNKLFFNPRGAIMKNNLFRILALVTSVVSSLSYIELNAMESFWINEQDLGLNISSSSKDVIEAAEKIGTSEIKKIGFQNVSLNDEKLQDLIPFFETLPRVEYINLRGNRIEGRFLKSKDEKTIKSFLRILWKPSLKYLDISCNSGIDSLETLQVLTSQLKKTAREKTPRGENIFDLLGPWLKILHAKLIWLPGAPNDQTLLPIETITAHQDYYINYFQED